MRGATSPWEAIDRGFWSPVASDHTRLRCLDCGTEDDYSGVLGIGHFCDRCLDRTGAYGRLGRPGSWRSQDVAYVGQSMCVRVRVTEHETARPVLRSGDACVSMWVFADGTDGCASAEQLNCEAALIETLAPRLNRSFPQPRSPWPFRHADIRNVPVSARGKPRCNPGVLGTAGVYMIHRGPYEHAIHVAVEASRVP